MAINSKVSALQSLQSALPVANQRLAAGQQSARDLQLQQAIAKAPARGNTAMAQETGAAIAQQAGAQQVQNQQVLGQQQAQVAQLQAGEQAQQNQQTLADKSLANSEQDLRGAERLARLDMRAKQELYDKELQFRTDESGRKLYNERQLMDYARVNAKSDEQLAAYSQQAEQLHKRKLEFMRAAQAKLEQKLEQDYQKAKQKGDQSAQLQIQGIRKDMADKIAQAAADANNKKAAWTTGGTIVGTAIGGFFGGVPGAMAGAAVGGAVGGAIGGAL